jgi:hypothetical protein
MYIIYFCDISENNLSVPIKHKRIKKSVNFHNAPTSVCTIQQEPKYVGIIINVLKNKTRLAQNKNH